MNQLYMLNVGIYFVIIIHARLIQKSRVQVAYHTALASASAIKEYHTLNQGGKIGIVLNLTPAYPRSDNPKDVDASRIAELFANKSF